MDLLSLEKKVIVLKNTTLYDVKEWIEYFIDYEKNKELTNLPLSSVIENLYFHYNVGWGTYTIKLDVNDYTNIHMYEGNFCKEDVIRILSSIHFYFVQ